MLFIYIVLLIILSITTLISVVLSIQAIAQHTHWKNARRHYLHPDTKKTD